jgi:xanthine dehydrogenase iron-sulfur cluster and FAD-binding subunit A
VRDHGEPGIEKGSTKWGIADGECGAVTVVQRANSDLRLSPHFHVLQLDGVYAVLSRNASLRFLHEITRIGSLKRHA